MAARDERKSGLMMVEEIPKQKKKVLKGKSNGEGSSTLFFQRIKKGDVHQANRRSCYLT